MAVPTGGGGASSLAVAQVPCTPVCQHVFLRILLLLLTMWKCETRPRGSKKAPSESALMSVYAVTYSRPRAPFRTANAPESVSGCRC